MFNLRRKITPHKRDIQNIPHAIPTRRRGNVGSRTFRIISYGLTKTVHYNAKIVLVNISVTIKVGVGRSVTNKGASSPRRDP